MPHTLPQALLRQAHTRGSAVALRYKRLGIWQVRTWSELAGDVGELAAALHQRGLSGNDNLLIISQARPEALLLALAAQWLGASVTLLDPEHDNRAVLAERRPSFVLAEDLQAVQQIGEYRVLIYLDGRGLNHPHAAGLIAYADLSANAPAPRLRHAIKRPRLCVSRRHPRAIKPCPIVGRRPHPDRPRTPDLR